MLRTVYKIRRKLGYLIIAGRENDPVWNDYDKIMSRLEEVLKDLDRIISQINIAGDRLESKKRSSAETEATD